MSEAAATTIRRRPHRPARHPGAERILAVVAQAEADVLPALEELRIGFVPSAHSAKGAERLQCAETREKSRSTSRRNTLLYDPCAAWVAAPSGHPALYCLVVGRVGVEPTTDGL